MAKERQARLLFAIGFVLMVAVAPTAFNRAAQAANTSPQAAAPAVSGPAAANSSPSGRLNAPEEPTARTVEALSQICRAGKEGQMWCGAYLTCRRQSRLSGGLALHLNLVRRSLLLPPMWMVLASGLLPAEPSSPFSIPNWLSGCELSGSNDLAWP